MESLLVKPLPKIKPQLNSLLVKALPTVLKKPQIVLILQMDFIHPKSLKSIIHL
jgi:hypothetical protein